MFISDGSEALFYLSRNPDSKHWVVQLQAGGSCGTYDSCLDRSKGPFGSSKNYSDFLTGTFVASDDPAENPMFSSWNKVFVPYCRYCHIIHINTDNMYMCSIKIDVHV